MTDESKSNLAQINELFGAFWLKHGPAIQKICLTARMKYMDKDYFLLDGDTGKGDIDSMSQVEVMGVPITNRMLKTITRSKDGIRDNICEAILTFFGSLGLAKGEDWILLYFVHEHLVTQALFTKEALVKKFNLWLAVSSLEGGRALKDYSTKGQSVPALRDALAKIYPNIEITSMMIYSYMSSNKGIELVRKFLHVYDSVMTSSFDAEIMDSISVCVDECSKAGGTFHIYGIAPAKYVELSQRSTAIASIHTAREVVVSQKLKPTGGRPQQPPGNVGGIDIGMLSKAFSMGVQPQASNSSTSSSASSSTPSSSTPSVESKTEAVKQPRKNPDPVGSIIIGGITYLAGKQTSSAQMTMLATLTEVMDGLRVTKNPNGSLTPDESGMLMVKIVKDKIGLVAAR